MDLLSDTVHLEKVIREQVSKIIFQSSYLMDFDWTWGQIDFSLCGDEQFSLNIKTKQKQNFRYILVPFGYISMKKAFINKFFWKQK